MKKRNLLILIFLFYSICNYAQSWASMSNFPGATRQYSTGFSIGHYGFVGCGSGASNYKDFYKWDKRTNNWTRIADYPGLGYGIAPTGFSIGGYGYVCCGMQGGKVAKDLWRYDTTANKWTQMASLPGPGRYDATVFVMGHKAFIITGSTGGPPYLSDVWEYDAIANSWTQKNSFPGGQIDATVTFSIGNKSYAGGGWDGGSNHNQFWQYDSANDSWLPIANIPLPMGSGDPRAFVVKSKAYACITTSSIGNAAVYDTITKNWCVISVSNSLSNRFFSVALSIEGNGYISTGGLSGNYLNDLLEFQPANLQFKLIDSTVCYGVSTNFTINTPGITGPFSWYFNGANPSFSNVSNPLVVFDSSGVYNVTLITDSGCNTNSFSRNVQININHPPLIKVSGNFPLCKGITDTLKASGGGNYLWSTGATMSSIEISPLSTTTYMLSVNSASGCKADTTIEVKVGNVAYGYISGSNSICKDSNTILTVNGGSKYIWNTGDTTASLSISPTSDTNFTVIVGDSLCSNDTTLNVFVTVNTKPVPFVSGGGVIC